MRQPTSVDTAAVDSARVDNTPFFFIGPYGPRVSFSSQQNRALNLVHALEKRGDELKAGSEVAVIGAGVAGVTAAAALIRLGYAVWLFDASAQPLTARFNVTHRYIHPDINFWPRLANIEPTTFLPFLDWCADNPHNVLSEIRKQWDADFADFIRNDGFTRTIKSREWDGASEKTILRDDRGETHAFDVVFVACGFGKEQNLGDPDQKPYWSADDIETDYVLRNVGHFVVSGAGDGGLIETLRLIHLDFRPGYLVEDLVNEIARTCPDVKKKLPNLAISAEKVTDAVDPRDKISEHLKAAYDKILPKLSKGANRLLDASYGDLTGPRKTVELVGRFKHPFEIGAAPIHRLMIAHALQRKVIKATVGKVDYLPAKKKFTLTEGAKVRLLDRHQVIVRHGTDRQPVLVRKPEDKRLRRQQADAGLMVCEVHYPLPELDDDQRVELNERRAEIADRALGRQFALNVKYAWDPSSGDFRYEASRIPPRIQIETTRDIARRPKAIFGEDLHLPKKRSNTQEPSPLLGTGAR